MAEHTTAMTSPIPVRFRKDEGDFLQVATARTGISQLELIRRGVRLLRRQQQIVNSFAFILDLGEQPDKKG